MKTNKILFLLFVFFGFRMILNLSDNFKLKNNWQALNEQYTKLESAIANLKIVNSKITKNMLGKCSNEYMQKKIEAFCKINNVKKFKLSKIIDSNDKDCLKNQGIQLSRYRVNFACSSEECIYNFIKMLYGDIFGIWSVESLLVEKKNENFYLDGKIYVEDFSQISEVFCTNKLRHYQRPKIKIFSKDEKIIKRCDALLNTNSVLIDGKWKRKNDKIGKYSIIDISKFAITLKDDEFGNTKKVKLGKSFVI